MRNCVPAIEVLFNCTSASELSESSVVNASSTSVTLSTFTAKIRLALTGSEFRKAIVP